MSADATGDSHEELPYWQVEQAKAAAQVALALAQRQEALAKDKQDLDASVAAGGFWGLVAWGQKLMNWCFQQRPARAYFRYFTVRGNLLAGGFAYTAMFSLAGVITLLITVCRFVLASSKEYQDKVFDSVNESLPGAIAMHGNYGLIDPSSITTGSFTLTTIISISVLIAAGYRMMVGLRISVQAIFGLAPRNDAWWQYPLRDICMFFLFGFTFTVSLGLSTATVMASNTLLEWIGWSWNGWSILIRLTTSFLTIVVDALTVWLLIRFHALVKAPVRDLFIASISMSVISYSLRLAGTAVVASSASRLSIAPFAIIITLMLWVNLFSRLLLFTCAWLANPPLCPPARVCEHPENSIPNYVSMSFPHTLFWPHDPITGQLFSQTPSKEASPIYNRYVNLDVNLDSLYDSHGEESTKNLSADKSILDKKNKCD